MIAKIENHTFDITKNIKKNMYIGKCINDTTIEDIHGDTIEEVIQQAEEIIRDKESK